MAEYHQVLACVLTARRWFDSENRYGREIVLEKLWADPVGAERAEDAPIRY